MTARILHAEERFAARRTKRLWHHLNASLDELLTPSDAEFDQLTARITREREMTGGEE